MIKFPVLLRDNLNIFIKSIVLKKAVQSQLVLEVVGLIRSVILYIYILVNMVQTKKNVQHKSSFQCNDSDRLVWTDLEYLY